MTRTLLRALVLLALPLATATRAADPVVEQIDKAMAALFGGQKPDAVEKAPVPGLYQVLYAGRLFYVTPDGQFLIDGTLYDVAQGRNLSADRLAVERRKAMAVVGPGDTIDFGPKDAPWTVFVFTDIDCPYCQKLHSQIQGYNELGIRIRYLLYPRTPPGSPSYVKAVSVWCSGDRAQALTRAKAGEQIPVRTCDNPVARNQELGRKVGVSGTPAIVTPSGRLLPGYLPPKDLLQRLQAEIGPGK